MATIQDIQQVANYRGQADAGGGNLGILQLDLQPYQRLADYTLLKNRAEYQEQKQQFNQAVQTAAKDLSVDWSKILPPHRQELLTELNDVKKFAREHPDAWSQSSKYFGELQQKKNDFKTRIDSAIGRGIEYEVALEQARKASLAGADLDAYKSALDTRIGGIYDKIDPFADFQLKPSDLTAGMQKVSNDAALPNYIQTTSQGVLDLPQLDAVAGQIPLDSELRPGLGELSIQRGMAENLNQMLGGLLNDPRMIAKNTEGQPIAFTNLAKGNGSVGQIIRDAEAFNAEVKRYNELNPDTPVAQIDLLNGVDDNEIRRMLVYKKSVAENKAIDRSNELKYTGDKTKRDIASMEEAGRNARAKWDNAAQVEAAAIRKDNTAQQLTTDAATFADRIDSLVQAGDKSKISGGMISFSALSPLDKKSLGIYDKDGALQGKYKDKDESTLFIFKGPKGGFAIAEETPGESRLFRKNDPASLKTIDSYSKEDLKGARLDYWLRTGSGKEYSASGELNPNGLPAPATTTTESSSSSVKGTTSSGLPIF